MGTKNSRSGLQYNPKGTTQGNTLVDYRNGEPITTVTDINGNRRLCVDAALSVDNVVVDTRPLDCTTDNIEICDPTTGAHLHIETDGSINVNTITSAASGDSQLIVGTEDGTLTGTQHVVKVLSDGELLVKSSDVPSTPSIFNVSVPLANVEVSQVLPSNTKKFTIRVRDSKASIQLAYSSGQSSTNYLQINRGTGYTEEGINATTLTLFFQVSHASQIVEIVAWT